MFADPGFQRRLEKVQATRKASVTDGPVSGHVLRRSHKGAAARGKFRLTSYP